MKPNIWNIKETMSVPPSSGGKQIGTGRGASDYSSMSDSQFLLSSQLWPENSQGLSEEMSIPSRSSQQTSQEMTMCSSYSSKPPLFAGEGKMLNFSGGKTVGTLNLFEEEKKKGKEKYERDILTHGILQLPEALENIREILANRIEGSSDKTRMVLLTKLDTFLKTIEDNCNSVKESIECRFETLQSQTQKDFEERESKNILAAKDLSSKLHNFQNDMEQLKAEQSKEQGMLGEILSRLSSLISVHKPSDGPGSVRMIDSEVQTSPGLLERFSAVSAEPQRDGLCNRPVIYPGDADEENQCPLKQQKTRIRSAHEMHAKGQQVASTRGLSPDVSQKLHCNQLARPSSPTAPQMSSFKGNAYIYPDKPMEAEIQKMSAIEKKSKPPLQSRKVFRRRPKANYRRKKALAVAQSSRFSNVSGAEHLQCDGNSRVPLSCLCDSWINTSRSSEENQSVSSAAGAEQQLLPFNPWTQVTNDVEYKLENVVPKPEGSVTEGDSGLWQLFDLINDSE